MVVHANYHDHDYNHDLYHDRDMIDVQHMMQVVEKLWKAVDSSCRTSAEQQVFLFVCLFVLFLFVCFVFACLFVCQTLVLLLHFNPELSNFYHCYIFKLTHLNPEFSDCSQLLPTSDQSCSLHLGGEWNHDSKA